MLFLLSPTKTMRPNPASAALPAALAAPSERLFPARSAAVRRALEASEASGRAKLWNIKGQLLARCESDFQAFSFDAARSPALLAYTGLQYKNLDAPSLDDAALDYLSSRLLIVSALYGLLRPADRVMPYRLEMQAKLPLSFSGRNYPDLYAFWQEPLNAALQNRLSQGEPLIMLCSGEYSKVLSADILRHPACISCHFGSLRNGRFRSLATRAKQARGQITRFAARRQLRSPAELRAFTWEGLRFNAELSDEQNYCFC